MEYYYHPASPNCRKVTAVLDDLGLTPQMHVVDLPSGAQTRPEYLAINPNGMVPALVDGDITLWESNAIMVYLAERVGSDLWPADERRIHVLKWMFWEQSHFMSATGTVFYQRLIKPLLGQEPDDVRIQEGLARFHRLAKVLDAHLGERQYLVGSGPTLADLAVAANLSYAGPIGLPVEEYPSVVRWLERLDRMPAWKGSEPPKLG